MKCQNCGLINPQTQTRCDCGYDFISHSIADLHAPIQKASSSNRALLKQYAISCGVAVLFCLVIMGLGPNTDGGLGGVLLYPGWLLMVRLFPTIGAHDLEFVLVLGLAIAVDVLFYGCVVLLVWRAWTNRRSVNRF
jgi:hypothetical protein